MEFDHNVAASSFDEPGRGALRSAIGRVAAGKMLRWLALLGKIVGAATAVCAASALAAADATVNEPNEASANASSPALADAQTAGAIPVAASGATDETSSANGRRSVGVGIAEIVVTAQKRSESINNVPIAISAFTGDSLKELGVTDTRDLARLVPGFSASESGGNTTIYTLRGVGFNDTTYTATGTVGTYIDEVNLPYSIMTRGANIDVKRVEVLKGPQGTLYGRNTTGGLVNYVPNDPTGAFEAGTNTSFGRYDTVDTESYISGPITDDQRGRLSVRVVHSDQGYQHSQSRPGDTLGKQNKLAARGIIDWDPSATLTVRFTGSGWYDKGQPQAPQVVGFIPQNRFVGCAVCEFNNYPVFTAHGNDPSAADWAEYPWKLNDSFMSGSIKPIWKITDSMSLTTIISALQVRSDGSGAIGGLPQFNADAPALNARIRTLALESRLSDQWWNGRFNWSVGINLSRDEGYEDHHLRIDSVSSLFPIPDYYDLPAAIRVIVPANLLGTRFTVSGTTDIKQGAVFVNTDTKLVDSISFNFGVRYTGNKIRATGCSADDKDDPDAASFSTLTTALSALAAAETITKGMPGQVSVIKPGDCFDIKDNGSNEEFLGNLNEHNLSGRAALNWKPDEDSLYYGSISRGYKAGGFPVLNATRQVQLAPVMQEQLLAYEVGAKLSFLDRRIHTNLSSFYYDYKNKQLLTKLLDPIFGPVPVLKNAPKSHVYGFEFDTQVTPFRGFFVALAASYVQTRVDEFVSTNSNGKQEDFAGKPFNFAPKFGATLTADYTWAVSDALDMGVAADFTYTGETNASLDELPVYDMQSSRVFGARVHLGKNDGVWTVAGFVRNLTNEYITTGVFNAGDPVSRFSALPRTYGITVNYHYQ